MMIKVSDLTPEELAFYNSIQVKRTWGAFEAFWAKLGEVAYLTEKRDNIQAEINKIRATMSRWGVSRVTPPRLPRLQSGQKPPRLRRWQSPHNTRGLTPRLLNRATTCLMS
jgi:hypothetical protein